MKLRSAMFVVLGASVTLFLAGCGSESSPASPSGSPAMSSQAPQARAGEGPDAQYCAHIQDPKCAKGSYLGPFVSLTAGGGHWDANGAPVNGGPVGADGSTGNNLTQEYCARNEDPACPIGSYVAPNAIRNPDGSHTFVACEGTVCTNPNHGGADPAGTWGPDGQPVNGGPVGADGSPNNNLTQEYCAKNQDPGCPVGSYVAPNAIQNPDGSNGYVPCEGTICTNPNHGAGDAPETAGPSVDDTPDVDAPPQGDDSGDAGDVTTDTPEVDDAP